MFFVSLRGQRIRGILTLSNQEAYSMGAGRKRIRAGLILVCFLLLLPLGVLADDDTAKDLTKSCAFTCSGVPR